MVTIILAIFNLGIFLIGIDKKKVIFVELYDVNINIFNMFIKKMLNECLNKYEN